MSTDASDVVVQLKRATDAVESIVAAMQTQRTHDIETLEERNRLLAGYLTAVRDAVIREESMHGVTDIPQQVDPFVSLPSRIQTIATLAHPPAPPAPEPSPRPAAAPPPSAPGEVDELRTRIAQAQGELTLLHSLAEHVGRCIHAVPPHVATAYHTWRSRG